MSKNTAILVIGQVTRDIIRGEERLGGAAAYVARTLSACGRNVALVTRAPDDQLLKPLVTDRRIQLHRLPSDSYTTFVHHFTAGQRRLSLKSRAAGITASDIPSPWRHLPFVFLVPVMEEFDSRLLTAFPESELVVGAQGWLRTVEPSGRVIPTSPPEALLTTRLLAVSLSEEDHPAAEAYAGRMSPHCRVAALTRGAKPLTIFEKHTATDIPVELVQHVHDTNGAGDVFTAMLGLRIMAGRTATTAVHGAAQDASHYVAEGMAGLGKVRQVDEFLPPALRAKSRIRALIARSTVVEDPKHAENTWHWLLRLDPAADDPLQIAALGHDVDRATPERVKRSDFADNNAFKAAHARRSARLLRGILEDCGLETTTINETCRLVELHEVGGDPRADLLKDADGISFFDVNLPLYSQRMGWEETRRRAGWGYQRLSDRAQAIVHRMTYDDDTLNRLLKDLKASANRLEASTR